MKKSSLLTLCCCITQKKDKSQFESETKLPNSSLIRSPQTTAIISGDPSKLDGLPLEITTNILSRLPMKSVYRCGTVCKTWCSIINNPLFLNMLLFKQSSSFILLPIPYQGTLYIRGEERHTVKSSNLMLPSSADNYSSLTFPTSSPHYSFLGTCSGLVCVSRLFCLDHAHPYYWYWAALGSHHSMYICNPSKQEYVRLPNCTTEGFLEASGFGFDPSSKELKVVQISSYRCQIDRVVYRDVHVHTLGSKSWRLLRCPKLKISGGPGVFVNGSVHWLDIDFGSREGYLFHIVSFHFGVESFGVIPKPNIPCLPNPPSDDCLNKFKIGVLGGCLCLSDCYSFDDRFEIWVMREYNVSESWAKQFVIKKPLLDNIHTKEILPVSVQKGELVLLCDSRFLVSYNIESGKFSLIEDDELPKCDLRYRTFPYASSLISPISACKIDRNSEEAETSEVAEMSEETETP